MEIINFYFIKYTMILFIVFNTHIKLCKLLAISNPIHIIYLSDKMSIIKIN